MNDVQGTMKGLGGAFDGQGKPKPQMHEPRSFATRSYLILLSLLLTLPVLAIAGYLTYRFVDAEHRRFEREASELARQGVLTVERELQDVTSSIGALATSQALITEDMVEFERQAREAAAVLNAGIMLRDLSSRPIMNTLLPPGAPPQTSTRLADQDKEVLRTGSPAVSDYYIRIVDGKPAVSVVIPVKRQGEIKFFLSASLDPGVLRQALERMVPADWRATLIDRKGIVIARTGDPATLGVPATASFVEAARRGEQIWYGNGRTGEYNLGGIGRTKFGWIIGAGGPYAVFSADVRRTLWFIGLASLALLLAALTGAMLLARRISRPLLALTDLANHVGQGQTVTYAAGENREVNAVARRLAAASEVLEQQQRTLRQQAEEWKTILDTVPAGVWFTRDRAAARIESTPNGARLIRMAAGGNPSLTPSPQQQSLPFKVYRDGQPVEQPETLPIQRAAGRGETVLSEELEVRYDDGVVQHLLFNAAPLKDADGAAAGAVGAAVDITERKRAGALAGEQAALLEMVVRGGKLEECLTAVTSALARLRPGMRAAILLADAERLTFDTAFAADIPASFGDNVKGARIEELAIGACGTAVFTGEAVSCADIATDERWAPAWRDLCIAHGIHACLSQPIAAPDGRCFGSVMLCFDAPREADEWERRLAGMAAHLASITIERRRAFRALSDSEERMRLIADAMPGLIAYIDAGLRYRFFNLTYEHWFGFRREELIGRPVPEVLGEAAYAVVKPHVDAVLAGENVNFTARVPYRDGKTRDIEATYVPARDAAGAIMGFYAFVNDVSERKRFETALKESEQRQALALAAGRMGVWDWDVVNDKLIWNQSQYCLYGVTEKDFTPTHDGLMVFIVPEDRERLQRESREALRLGDSFESEFRIVRADGAKRWIAGRSNAIRDGAGKVVRVVGVNFDITERKGADEARSLLLHELNHRVKNTLAVIQSIAAQTLREAEVDQATRETLEARLFSLAAAHDILTRENWSGADLTDVVEKSLAVLGKNEERVTVNGARLRLPPKPALALTMALHELVTNAVKYGALSRPSGRVALDWSVKKAADGKRLTLTWKESGGPPVKPPRRKGFGSRLIERGLAVEFEGEVKLDYRKGGLLVTLDAPLPKLYAGGNRSLLADD